MPVPYIYGLCPVLPHTALNGKWVRYPTNRSQPETIKPVDPWFVRPQQFDLSRDYSPDTMDTKQRPRCTYLPTYRSALLQGTPSRNLTGSSDGCCAAITGIVFV